MKRKSQASSSCPTTVLWYLPFEALIPAAGKGDKTFADLFPVRYGPTAALAVSNPRPLRRPQHTGILAGDLKFAGEPADRDAALQELVGAVVGPLVLPEPLKEPARLVSPLLDGLIVLDDIQGDTLGEPAYLFPKSRGGKEKANAWINAPVWRPRAARHHRFQDRSPARPQSSASRDLARKHRSQTRGACRRRNLSYRSATSCRAARGRSC